MTTHTPGPWRISPHSTGSVIDGAGTLIASCFGYQNNSRDPVQLHRQQESDARLIAAAPDLLETLEYLENVLSEQSEETFERELIRIRYAIAKAEGRT